MDGRAQTGVGIREELADRDTGRDVDGGETTAADESTPSGGQIAIGAVLVADADVESVLGVDKRAQQGVADRSHLSALARLSRIARSVC